MPLVQRGWLDTPSQDQDMSKTDPITLTHDEIMEYALRHADIDAAVKLYVDRGWGGITMSTDAIISLIKRALEPVTYDDTTPDEVEARNCERRDDHPYHYWYGNFTYYCPGHGNFT